MKNIIVINGFYADPFAVRKLAFESDWISKNDLPKDFPGTESKHSFFTDSIISKIESSIGQKIVFDPQASSFGVFAKTSEHDAGKNPVHIDHTEWAGIVYLSTVEEGGTNFYYHKASCRRVVPSCAELKKLGFNDREGFRRSVVVPDQFNLAAWELDATVGMKFNRMVLFRAGHLFHSAASYYGRDRETERLLQLFFFNTKEQ